MSVKRSISRSCFLTACLGLSAQAAAPHSQVEGLSVRLFAEHPQITTPTGITVDTRDRLLVVENNTHFRPEAYPRHPTDRVLWMQDRDGDERADDIAVFHEGERFSTDLKAHPDGRVYLSTRNAVLRLTDADGDGRAEQREVLVQLETETDYPHNALSGLSFDAEGHLYFGMGENFGANFVLRGRDGSQIEGGGEGGSIFWCSKDGAQLRRVAVGFWNPFGTCVTSQGHVFATDNDPSSIAPNRLIHVIEGGDYGFQFRYGRSGISPLIAWNGERPGTLPMVTGIGEAACGIMEWNGGLLVASWGDHRIEYYPLKTKGHSFEAERRIILQGGTDFRPVAITAARDGSLYITDWVNRSYSLHGEGRVWKVDGARTAFKAVPPEPLPAPVRSLGGLADPDPFVRGATVHALSEKNGLLDLFDTTADIVAQQRVGFALAMLRNGDPKYEEHIPALLEDAAHDVRYVAARWVADRKLERFRPNLLRALDDPELATDLAMTFLAVLARLDGKQLDARSRDQYLAPIVQDEDRPTVLRVLALRGMANTRKPLPVALLNRLARHEHPGLRREAVWKLASYPAQDACQALIAVAGDTGEDVSLRADALAALDPSHLPAKVELLRYATGDTTVLRRAALRTLNGAEFTSAEKARLRARLGTGTDEAELFARVLGEPMPARPPLTDTTTWLSRLNGVADRDVGRRLFFNRRLLACSNCHRIDERGAQVGPDLTRWGQTRTRAQVLQAILEPSADVSAQYHTWIIKLKDGREVTGFLHAKRVGGAGQEEYVDVNGRLVTIKTDNVLSRQTIETSIMPPGLVHGLTDGELRDLVSYLRMQR